MNERTEWERTEWERAARAYRHATAAAHREIARPGCPRARTWARAWARSAQRHARLAALLNDARRRVCQVVG